MSEPSTKNLPILVTGAAGFIGARYVRSCNRLGLPVISVDEPKYFEQRREHRGIDFGQVIDRVQLFEWLKSTGVNVQAIVHLGACTDTTELNESYLKRVNLEYSQAVWEHAVAKKTPLIYASSGATYGDGSLGFDDDENLIQNLKPLNPYGESKRLFDLWVLDQEKKGSTPPTWAGFKFFNVYGFGERHKEKMSSVVVQVFDQIRERGSVRLFKSHNPKYRDGEQLRDFIHVDDVTRALDFARTHPIQRGIYNLGTGKARSFLDLARAVFRTMNQAENIEYMDTPAALRQRYQYYTQAKTERLRGAGYTPAFLSLEDGVKQYVQELLAFEK